MRCCGRSVCRWAWCGGIGIRRRGLVPESVGWATIIHLIQSGICTNAFPDKSGPTEPYTTGRRGLVPEGVGWADIILPDTNAVFAPTSSRTSPVLPNLRKTGRGGLVPEGVGWATIVHLIQSGICTNAFPDKSPPTGPSDYRRNASRPFTCCPASKLPSASQPSNAFCSSGHSPSSIEYHAVLRFWPLTTMC